MRILKKTPRNKRVSLPRAADFARSLFKDWERLSRSGRYDMVRLKKVMLALIANDDVLGPEWRDHALKGECANYRECHAGGDFLLIYQADSDSITFIRAGTHAELF